MTDTLDGIDVFSSDVYTSGIPHEQFAALRGLRGMLLQRIPDPDLEDEAFVAARYDDVIAVARDSDHFTIADGHNIRRVRGRSDSRNLLVLDDPEHLTLRLKANKGFTPRTVRRFEQHYRDLADRILDEALDSGGDFDFVTAVSARLPLAAICELIGAPADDHERVFAWSNAIIGTEDAEYSTGLEGRMRAGAEMAEYTQRLAGDRLANPRDDLLTRLAVATRDGEMTNEEFFMYILLLFVAGNETTRNNISHGVMALIEHPAAWQALANADNDDPLWDTAVDEITRWATPVIYMSRTCTNEVQVGEQLVRPGQVVAMFYPSANRDEAVFGPTANEFDITRDPNPHVSFGFSTHFCLGAHLARLETKMMLQQLLRRVSSLELTGPPSHLRSSFIHGMKHLPVRAQLR